MSAYVTKIGLVGGRVIPYGRADGTNTTRLTLRFRNYFAKVPKMKN